MNDRITPDDPRLVALALGDIADPAERAALSAAVAADPALAAAVAEHRRMAGALKKAFAREPLPFANPAAVAARAVSGEPARRPARRASGGSLSVIGREKPDTLRWAPFAVAAGLAACVALVVVSRQPETGVSVATVPVEKRTPVAMNPVRPADATFSARALAGILPGLRDADGAFRPAGRAPLALSAAHAKDYAVALSRELASGRRLAAGTLRVDGLVNAFVTARPVAPGNRPVLVETALTDAPWDASRRLLRVTVRAQGTAGETVARNAVASVDFDAAGVKSWRVLGHEGKVAAIAGASLRAGETVTTLYEITPAAGDTVARVALRYSPVAGNGAETVAVPVKSADRRVLVATDADTRFAAALAAYALNLGDSPASALAAAAGDDADRKAFAALAR